MKDSFWIDCKKTGFWACRKCEPSSTASAWRRISRILHFLPAIASEVEQQPEAPKQGKKDWDGADKDDTLAPIVGNSLCLQTSADSSYALMVVIGSAEVRIKDSTLGGLFHLPTIVAHFTFGCHCLLWDGDSYQNPRKKQIVRLYLRFARRKSSFFSRNWDASWLATT